MVKSDESLDSVSSSFLLLSAIVASMPETKKRKASKAEQPNKSDGDRRHRILATTLRLIAEEGLNSITQRKVAGEAGIPLGSLTYHFASRSQLLRNTFDHFLEHTRAVHDLRPGDTKIASVDDLALALEGILKRDVADEFMLMAEYELTLFAARDPVVAESLKQWDHEVISCIAEELESLGAPKPFEGARTILHLIRGCEIELITRHVTDTSDYRRRITNLIHSFIRA